MPLDSNIPTPTLLAAAWALHFVCIIGWGLDSALVQFSVL